MNKFPIRHIMIEISSVCNIKCIGCPNGFIKRRCKFIDKELFFDIFKKYGNKLEKVFLWNYGEPLLHPNIEELLSKIKGYKCKKILSTNGMNLNSFKNLLFLSSLDEIIISVNGYNQKTYEYHQKGGNLKNVLNGIKKLTNSLKNTKTKIIFQTVINKKNINQISRLKRLAKKLGCHELKLKVFNVMDNKKNTFSRFIPLKNKMSKYINFSKYKFNLNLKNIIKKLLNYHHCEQSMVINSDGTCNLCFEDYSSKYILGKLSKKNNLLKIWNSKKANLYRKKAKNNELDICKKCTEYSILVHKKYLLN